MSTYRIAITPRAFSDLEKIRDYIAKDSPRNADAVISRIIQSLEPLKDFPHRTVVADQKSRIKYPVRSLPVESYIVFFRVMEAEKMVRVVAVRHGAMKRPKRFD